MKRNLTTILMIALALLLTLTGCERSASTAPTIAANPNSEVPFPVTTKVTNFATQTAIAAAPKGPATGPTQPALATATPAPQAGQPAQPTQAPDAQQGGGQAPVTPQVKQQAQPTSAPAQSNESSQQYVAPALTRPATYTLQKGEWPICIARRYNLDINALFNANGLNMNSRPGAGTVLTIPASGTWSSAYGNRYLRSHPTTYTVLAGDTVYTIACQFGDVDPGAILGANGFSSANDIKSGQKIQIP